MAATGYYNSPFYPNIGGGASFPFRIQYFTNNKLFNETGSIVDDITFH